MAEDKKEDNNLNTEKGSKRFSFSSKKLFKRLLKISFILSCIVLVVFAVLAGLGGNSDTLKGAIEDFVSDSTFYKAEIANLNHMGFFPAVELDFENLTLHDKSTLEQVAEVDAVFVTMDFKDVIFRTGKIAGLNIQEIKIYPDILSPAPLYIKSFALSRKSSRSAYEMQINEMQGKKHNKESKDNENGNENENKHAAFLSMNGFIDSDPFFIEMDMGLKDLKEKEGIYKYSFINNPEVVSFFDNIRIGFNINNSKSPIMFENIEIYSKEKKQGPYTGGAEEGKGEKVLSGALYKDFDSPVLKGEIHIHDIKAFTQLFEQKSTLFFKKFNVEGDTDASHGFLSIDLKVRLENKPSLAHWKWSGDSKNYSYDCSNAPEELHAIMILPIFGCIYETPSNASSQGNPL